MPITCRQWLRNFVVSTLLNFLMVSSGFAFDWHQCSPIKEKAGLFFFTTSFVSSTSSSTGPCSLLQSAPDERIDYLSRSLNQILLDMAQGDGEYLRTLLLMYKGGENIRHTDRIIARAHRSNFDSMLAANKIVQADQVMAEAILADDF